jgi:penicillin-binding protein 1A
MTEVYRRKPPPPDWPRPISIVTRDIDVSSGLLQTPYCPRELVTTEFYISGTEPTRDCDKHGQYANPGLTPIDTFSTIPITPSSPRNQTPITVSPPIQPGYEGVPPRRAPTVFDTTRANALRRDSVRANIIRRDSARPRTDTSPTAVPPPAMTPR